MLPTLTHIYSHLLNIKQMDSGGHTQKHTGQVERCGNRPFVVKQRLVLWWDMEIRSYVLPQGVKEVGAVT
jgi:hypothetical protein